MVATCGSILPSAYTTMTSAGRSGPDEDSDRYAGLLHRGIDHAVTIL
jgi:hypothetical protein